MNTPESQPNSQPSAVPAEQAQGAPGQSPEQAANALEHAPAAPEAGNNPSQAMPASVPSIPPATIPSMPKSDVTTTTQSTSTTVADDGDLIEKEWIDRAKKIVEANREDPYKQSEELTVVKADYMQKRYNKTIKLK